MNQTNLCSQCKKEILTANYVKCFNCNSNYHFTPCYPLSEGTYQAMYGERKTSWRCHVCKPRNRAPNTLYQTAVADDNNRKQPRTDNEEEQLENEQTKKFKEAMSLTSVQSDVTELKSDMKEIKRTIDQLVAGVNATHMQIREDIKNALAEITTTLTAITTQVKELNEKDKQREKQLNTMEKRINNLEQELINKNIEIKNVTNNEISPYEVVKTIGKSIGIDIRESDVNNAYRLNKKEKIIVEFSVLKTKNEFMSKIKRHRVDANIVNKQEVNNETQVSYIYINDEITFNNRRLLWMAKTKAKEAKWKFVWVRNGKIFARKNENSPLFIINNNADIELISSTN